MGSRVWCCKAPPSHPSVPLPSPPAQEFHPRCALPQLRAVAREMGMVLTAYGSGNSCSIEKSEVVARCAARRGLTPHAVVLLWTLARGVAVIPRSANEAHIAANIAVAAAGATQLEEEDLLELDGLDQAHVYYWSGAPTLPPGTPPDVKQA